MERKFLESLTFGTKGTTLDKEAVDKIMAEYGKSVESKNKQITDLTSERDGLKTQLKDVGEKLAAFDGTDPEALKKEIETLKGDIATKEKDFQQQLADRDFTAAVNAEIVAAKGKNPKVIMAGLDLDTLKASKNQKTDIAAAVKALSESDAYLFGETAGKENDTTGKENNAAGKGTTPAKVSTGGSHDDSGGKSSTSTNDFMNAQIRGTTKGE